MKALITCLLFLIGCNDSIVSPEEEQVEFTVAGWAYWQLQHEDGDPVARVMLDMYAYYDGVVDDVWFHGKIFDYETFEHISEDSVYIGHFEDSADTLFSIYKQDGYNDRPYGRWSMWVSSE